LTTHYLLRNGKTIVDVEVTKDDLHCVVCIDEYSSLLIAKQTRQDDVIVDFHMLQEIRGEWHENQTTVESLNEFVKRRLREIGDKYTLQYGID
jgi:hypothetical protein